MRELFLELLDRRCVLSLLQLIRGLVFGVGVQRNVRILGVSFWIPFEIFFSLIKSAICRPPSTSWLFRGVNHERPLSRPPSALSPCRMSSPPPPRGHYLIVAFDFQPSVHRFLSLDSSSHYLTVRSSLFIVYIFGGSRSNPAATSWTLQRLSDCNF